MMISAKKKVVLSLLSASILSFSPVLFGAATAIAAPAVVGLPDFADIVDRTGPSVVNIRTTERVKAGDQASGGADDEEMQEFFRRFLVCRCRVNSSQTRQMYRAIKARVAMPSRTRCLEVWGRASSSPRMASS